MGNHCLLEFHLVVMKQFVSLLAVLGSGLAAPQLEYPAAPYINQGAASGPLTPAIGDLVATPKGYRSLALEGFSEDLNQDGFVDPIGQASVPVATYNRRTPYMEPLTIVDHPGTYTIDTGEVSAPRPRPDGSAHVRVVGAAPPVITANVDGSAPAVHTYTVPAAPAVHPYTVPAAPAVHTSPHTQVVAAPAVAAYARPLAPVAVATADHVVQHVGYNVR